MEESESMVEYLPVLRQKTLGAYWMLGIDYSIEHEAPGLPFILLIFQKGSEKPGVIACACQPISRGDREFEVS